jgi:hypothetical protein
MSTDHVSTDGVFPEDSDFEQWSLLALLTRDKRVLAGVLVLLASIVGVAVIEIEGPKVTSVSDSTSCSQWGSVTDNEQAAYARLYLREHRVLPDGATGVANVEYAINFGCVQAYGSDEEDSVSVLQAIRGQY